MPALAVWGRSRLDRAAGFVSWPRKDRIMARRMPRICRRLNVPMGLPARPDAAPEKGPVFLMTDSNTSRPVQEPIRPTLVTHLYKVGQAVRLRSEFRQKAQGVDIYHITGTLPARGGQPQYRIRNDSERHERVTTQDNLELASASHGNAAANLIEKTFGHG